MEKVNTQPIRNSRMEFNNVYFWTDTIKDWKRLLKNNSYKWIIIEQLQWMVNRKKILVYGFVIMPNHIHLIWELLEANGKEMPHASFNKWTSSSFLKDLRMNYPKSLHHFEEKTRERNHRFWQRDPLAILIDSIDKLEQKLDYIHLNPLHERWNLATTPESYEWSSAEFYYSGKDRFNLLTHYMDRF